MKYYLLPVVIAASLLAFTSIEKKVTVSFKNITDTIPSKNNRLKKAKKELIYDLPDDVVTDTGAVSFARNFKKGRAIYIQTCAKCHDSTRDGRKIYPDFSLPQLMDYEMRFQYPAHQDELRETAISHDELELVISFLRYKKKNLPVTTK